MKITVTKKPTVNTRASVEIDILTPVSLRQGEAKYTVIKNLLKYNFMPEIMNSALSIGKGSKKGFPFSEKRIEEMFQYCKPYKLPIGVIVGDSIYFSGKRPIKFDLAINIHEGRTDEWHNSINLELASSRDRSVEEAVTKWFREMILLLQCDFARIQFYSGESIQEAARVVGKEDIFLSGSKLGKNLPDIYAVTVLGKPYIDVFGRERLLSTPCKKAEELSSDHIWLQLGEDILDEGGSKEALRDVRQAVKAHLDKNVFFDPDLPPAHKYSVPEFDLSEIRAPINLPDDEGK